METLASPHGGGSGRSPRAPGELSFAENDLVGGRYRVIRFLGVGGMGEVYECEDRLLGETVALKTIRPEIASDPAVLSRFRREIQLARRVTHTGVCRIFDVGIHRRVGEGDAPSIDLAFLTMELLGGPTLAERLKDGPIPLDEAYGLAVQVASALEAAHEAGVVHRDFKPQNVMLVPSERPGAPPRAVVTDFGLARGRVPDARGADTVTGAGGIVGSPAYMAPEQVEGGDVGPAADQYALAVVLYQMVTGVLPFVGETPLATAAKRLKGPPPPPSRHAPDLDPAWEAAILRALEREPEQRFERVTDLPAALRAPAPAMTAPRSPAAPQGAQAGKATADDGTTTPKTERPALDRRGDTAQTRIPDPPARARGAALVAAFVLGSVGAGAGFAWFAQRGGGESAPATPPATFSFQADDGAIELFSRLIGPETRDHMTRTARTLAAAVDDEDARACSGPTVAVMGFKNLSGAPESAWISTALVEMLTTELGAGEKLHTVPGEIIARLRRERVGADVESYAADTLAAIRGDVCATHVLVGSYVAQGQGEGAQLRLDLRLQDTATGRTLAQVAETGPAADLIGLVGRAGARLREEIGVAELTPAETAVARAVMPRSTEAARLYTQGLAELRREECRDAQGLLEGAVAADPRFALARAYLAEALFCVGYEEAGKAEAKKAMALVEAGGLPRRETLMVTNSAAMLLGEHEQALAASQTLWEFYPNEVELGLSLAQNQMKLDAWDKAAATVAALRALPPPANQHPRIDMLEADLAGKRNDKLAQRQAYERAAERAEARGYRLMAAAARMNLLGMYVDAGEMDKAAETARHVLAVGREFGDRELEVVGLDSLCMLAARAGRLADAEPQCKQALAVATEVGIGRRLPRATVLLAWVRAERGHLREGTELLRGALAAGKKRGKGYEKAAAGMALGLARLEVQRGDLPAAEKALAEARAGFAAAGRKEEEIPDLAFTDGVLARARGDLAGAEKALELARERARARGYVGFVAEIDMERARLYADAGKTAEALAVADETIPELEKRGAKDDVAAMHAVRAGALLAGGKLEEARAALAPALAWIAGGENILVLGEVRMVEARVAAAEGAPEAADMMGRVMRDAKKSGAGILEVEAAVAVAEHAFCGGQAHAKSRAAAAERLARARGLDGLARRAANACRG